MTIAQITFGVSFVLFIIILVAKNISIQVRQYWEIEEQKHEAMKRVIESLDRLVVHCKRMER